MLTLPVLLLSSVVCGSAAPDLDNGVLNFTAKWCGPCQQMSPIVSKLERAGLPIFKLDFDQNKTLAKKYGISQIPAFLLVVNGKVVKQLSGPQSETTLRQLCAQVPPPQSADPADPPNGADRAGPAAPRSAETAFAPTRKNRKPNEEADPAKKGQIRGQSPGNPQSNVPAITNQPFPATVRIRVKDATGDDVGTGTIILNDEEQAIILTCGHLFKHWDDKTSRLMIEVFERGSGRVLPGRKIAVDADGDVALIGISIDKPLPSCPLAPRGTKPPKNSSLTSVGCNGGQPPTIEQHKLVTLNRYKGPDNLECTGIPVRGRSGGGLFNQAGEVVGVCMAEDPSYKDGMYAGLEPVYRLLARSELAPLFAGAAPARDALAEAEADADSVDDQAGSPGDDEVPGPAENDNEELDGSPGSSDQEDEQKADQEEPQDAAEQDGATQKILRKALAQARKGDIVCLIPDEDGDPAFGSVLVIHEPGDELRRTLAGGPETAGVRSASFRGLPPADVRAQMKRPAQPRSTVRARNVEVEMNAPPSEWEDDMPLVQEPPRNRAPRSNAQFQEGELPEPTTGGFRRGRPMSLRGDVSR